ncbi:MAG: segregation and condensation protein A [Neisseriaceae bacterium]
MSKSIARLNNQDINDLPKDLYINPEALLVFLEMFEGPLDLLIYLIRKQNIDILNIPIVQITTQYIAYINAMTTINIDLASEYLAMAATLLAIKSRMMLPRPPKLSDETEGEDDVDPRIELMNKLIEYEQIKEATQRIANLPIAERDYKWVHIEISSDKINPQVTIDDLKVAWQAILLKAISQNSTHNIEKQELSVREYMTNILKKLAKYKKKTFYSMFDDDPSVQSIIVNFIAILELTKEGLILLELQKNDIILVLK